jgi:hypothetical protein
MSVKIKINQMVMGKKEVGLVARARSGGVAGSLQPMLVSKRLEKVILCLQYL